MQIQLIRNATLRVVYSNQVFITDPYFAYKHSQEPLVGKSRNPIVDLPFPIQNILDGIEVVLVSHLHPDHFDSSAQGQLPKNIQVLCQPGDEAIIKAAGFSNVAAISESMDWRGIKITRVPGRHGSESWSAQMGPVSGFVFRAEQEPTLYWTGDTVWYDGVKDVILDTKPDIIITHSSGASFVPGEPIIMDGQQTIMVCRAAPAAVVIAVHMETFDFDTVSRQDLRAMAEEEEIGAEQLHIPADGETLLF